LTWAGKHLFLSGGRDRGEVRFWDPEKKGELQVLPMHIDGVDALAASEDGRWALSGGRDNKVFLHDLTGGQPSKPLGSHGNRVSCIAFGPPNSRTAVSAGLDQKFFVWDLAKGTHQSFSAPGDLVRCLAVAPDGGSFLAGVRVGDEDRVVWRDLNGNELAAPFGEGKGPYLSVAYSADGVYALVYCGGDQTLRRWELTRKDAIR
jgi:WD40 repeat protein